jgi:hypothetical protein
MLLIGSGLLVFAHSNKYSATVKLVAVLYNVVIYVKTNN